MSSRLTLDHVPQFLTLLCDQLMESGAAPVFLGMISALVEQQLLDLNQHGQLVFPPGVDLERLGLTLMNMSRDLVSWHTAASA